MYLIEGFGERAVGKDGVYKKIHTILEAVFSFNGIIGEVDRWTDDGARISIQSNPAAGAILVMRASHNNQTGLQASHCALRQISVVRIFSAALPTTLYYYSSPPPRLRTYRW